jgi:SAM-dependent methyltransferase
MGAATTRSWDDWGALNPLWAILTSPAESGPGWDRESFLRSGEESASRVAAQIDEHLAPDRRLAALDYGCGVGRVTRAWASRFEHVTGVDAAASMVAGARALNADVANVQFLVAEGPGRLPSNSFDLVYCALVLQHLGTRRRILDTLAGLVRVLRPDGLLVFQLPHDLPRRRFRDRLRFRSRAFGALRRLGFPREALFHRFRLHPDMTMTAISGVDIRAALNDLGATVLDAEDEDFVKGVRSTTYYVAKVRKPD